MVADYSILTRLACELFNFMALFSGQSKRKMELHRRKLLGLLTGMLFIDKWASGEWENPNEHGGKSKQRNCKFRKSACIA